MQGRSIPIAHSEFLIGRDPDCQLRPASAMISKRHCAVLVKGSKVFVRDFESTNGTAINNQPVKGERELGNGDTLRVGPLEFKVVLEVPATASKPAPIAKPAAVAASGGGSDDEAAAALLLSGLDDTEPGTISVDSDGVPTGSTVMEMIKPPGTEGAPQEEKQSGAAEREKAAKLAQGNTSTAAKAILERYMRRPRG
jgi:pSer/pThr/pTyr-binding forkhead associated (FHA) protein